ncbi:MAG: hypothetical protein HYU66_15005 [Armatimonadetes bacterium]|nr:hypothetical protein [Armatimonadota bacterium]
MPHRVRRWMGILLACFGGLAAAQAPPDPTAVRRDAAILENLVALALDQAQAKSILEAAPAAFAEAEKIEAARRKYYLETREASVAIEWAMIRGEPLDPAQFDALDAATARLARATDRSEKSIDLAVQKITARRVRPGTGAACRGDRAARLARPAAGAVAGPHHAAPGDL